MEFNGGRSEPSVASFSGKSDPMKVLFSSQKRAASSWHSPEWVAGSGDHTERALANEHRCTYQSMMQTFGIRLLHLADRHLQIIAVQIGEQRISCALRVAQTLR
jgi:hypothetical protein